MIRIARLLTFLSLVTLSGLDQALVQSYAWSTMILNRAPEQGVSEALNDTFSGEHPCEICLALAEVSEEEKEQLPPHQSADQLAKSFLAISMAQPGVYPPAHDAWPRYPLLVQLDLFHHGVITPPPERA